MAAIIRTRLTAGGSSRYRWQKDGFPVPTVDPSGFDSATGRLRFRGTVQDLYNAFPVGGSSGTAALPGAPSGSVFYCIGVQGTPRVEFGTVVAEIGWKGLAVQRNLASQPVSNLSNTDHVISSGLNMTTQEVTFPMERDGSQVYVKRPYCPQPRPGETEGLRTLGVVANGVVIPTALVPWRVRLIGRVYTASIRGITIGDRSIIVRAPKCTIPNPHLTDDIPARTFGWEDLPDPLVTWSDDTGDKSGWVCRNYQRPGGEYAMGSKILAFWSAEYEWVERYGP